MYWAHVVNVRTEAATARPFVSASIAARQLVTLMQLDGWTDDTESTVTRLVEGDTVTHKRFAYRVSEEP